jgi:protein-disulfide isomerase
MKNLTIAIVLSAGAAAGVAVDRAVVGTSAPPRAEGGTAPAQAQPPPAAGPGTPSEARVDDPKAVYRVPVDGSPTRGSSDALVTIVESADFECPSCKGAVPTMKQVQAVYGAKVRFVFKHNPLSMHRHAVLAATLAEEARLQGGDERFWAVHDRLFELPAIDAAALAQAATDLGLNEEALKTAITSGRHLGRIRRDQALMASLGATGTPTFFVNGRKVVGAVPFERIRVVVDEELARAEALARSGVARRDVYARTIEQGATAPVTTAAPPRPAAPPGGTAETAAAAIPLRPDDVVRGPQTAPVTIVLFSDFQCPFCKRVEPTLQQLEQAFPGKIRLAWKHQPLAFHPGALPAARAAEAARAQGKFWEMHEKLFSDQQALSDATYERYARELGLDAPRLRRDAAGEDVARRIAEDQQLAARVGATGTPTLFVNCRKLVGAKPFESVAPVVREELAKAEARSARGERIDGRFYDRICADNVAAAPAVAAAAAPAPRTDVVVPVRADDPARGHREARITVIEFSDFQCPFCGRALPAVDDVRRTHGQDVRIVWKHMPLAFHPNAMPAALAAEAAREQGKFWEMHDRLFAHQDALSDAAYSRYAAELNLDLPRFRAALVAPDTRKRVEADLAAAQAAGVTGTPTFIVDGEVVLGAGGLKDAVERHLEAPRLAHR